MQSEVTQLAVCAMLVCDESVFHVCFRAAGAGGVQRAPSQLGQRLRSHPAPPAGPARALLYLIPAGLQKRTGLRVALHLLVSGSVACRFEHTDVSDAKVELMIGAMHFLFNP